MDSIRFQNYRCLSDTGDVSLKPLTFLLGANNSGKSSFLEFFPLLKQSVGVRRNGVFLWYANNVDFKDFWNTVQTNEHSIKISWRYDDFLASSSREIGRFKKLFKEKLILAERIQLKLSMTISEGKVNSGKLDVLKIEFFDNEVVLDIDDNGIAKITINGRSFLENNNELRLIDSTFLLPRLIPYFESDSNWYSSPFSDFFDQIEMFAGDEMKDIKELIHYGSVIYLKKDEYLNMFKSILKKEDVDYEKLRDTYLLANLDDIIETINYRISAEAYQLSYVKPLRVTPERYYRYQNYSVDDIDSDGKNLAMFLANLSVSEMRSFQNWTDKKFGFKIYALKHEGHVELAIGKKKQEARNLVDVGFGFTQLLPIITIIWNSLRNKTRGFFYPRVGNTTKTIAIEQPELHLHPRFQSDFAEVMAKVVQNPSPGNGVRFIIETHSEAIINKIGAMIQAGELDSDKVNVVIFNGEKEGLDSYVVESEFNEEGYLSKWPLGFFL